MRIKQFQYLLQQKGIDVALLYTMETSVVNTNLFYLANYAGYGFLIVPAQGEPLLIVPLLDIEYAEQATVPYRVWDTSIFSMMQEKLQGIPLQKIGVEEKRCSVFVVEQIKKKAPSVSFEDVTLLLEQMRAVKSEEEQDILKKACAKTDVLFQQILDFLPQAKTEYAVQQYAKQLLLEHALEFSFPIVVASGKNPSSPHHIPSKKKIQKGFCVIDLGIKYKNYCTDMTRTVYLGKPAEKEKQIYTRVLKTQDNAIRFCALGKQYWAVEQYARRLLGMWEKQFIHALGHGIGLDVHENITFSKDAPWKIQENHVFTIEPGIYQKDAFGIRIEDDILMKKKPVILTKTPKDLLAIKI